MSDEQNQILDDAIARNQGVVLSLPSAGMLRHHKSRFLAVTPEGIWIEGAPADRSLIDELLFRQQPAAVSFKSSVNKASFATVILKREEQYQVNAQLVLEALLIRRPTEIKSVQRRSNYRVRANDGDLTAKIWRIAEQAELQAPPAQQQEVKIHVRDISLGGIGISVLPTSGGDVSMAQKMSLMMDERLRIELRGGDQQLLLEGRVRHLPRDMKPTAAANTAPVRVGVQFKKLENDLEGRRILTILTRIVGQMQRDEVRRLRLGLVNGDAA